MPSNSYNNDVILHIMGEITPQRAVKSPVEICIDSVCSSGWCEPQTFGQSHQIGKSRFYESIYFLFHSLIDSSGGSKPFTAASEHVDLAIMRLIWNGPYLTATHIIGGQLALITTTKLQFGVNIAT